MALDRVQIKFWHQTFYQLRAVDRADGHLVAVEAVVDHRAPLSVRALDDVRDDAMGEKLRTEIAGRVVRKVAATIFLPPSSLPLPIHAGICYQRLWIYVKLTK